MPEFGHNEESFSLVAQYYLYLLYFSIYFSCSFTLIRALLSKKVAITVFSSQHNIASSNQHVIKRQDKENDKKILKTKKHQVILIKYHDRQLLSDTVIHSILSNHILSKYMSQNYKTCHSAIFKIKIHTQMQNLNFLRSEKKSKEEVQERQLALGFKNLYYFNYFN